MDEIGAHGEEKHKTNSFQAARKRGSRERSIGRVSSTELYYHAIIHGAQHRMGIPHDHFHTLKHQLAAASFNFMMEYYYTGADFEGPSQLPDLSYRAK